EGKIERLKKNEIPIYEPGLDRMVEENQAAGRLQFTTDVADAASNAQVVFIAVGTPPDEDGSADLKYVLAATENIGKSLRREAVVVTKSTVPVGTARKVEAVLARHATVPYHVCSNPEFLKGGGAVDDFLYPDRGVVGCGSDCARSAMSELLAPVVRPRGGGLRERLCTLGNGGAVCAVRPNWEAHPVHGHCLRGDDQVRGQRHACHAHLVHERDCEPVREGWRERGAREARNGKRPAH